MQKRLNLFVLSKLEHSESIKGLQDSRIVQAIVTFDPSPIKGGDKDVQGTYR